jgi:hypothetical protein
MQDSYSIAAFLPNLAGTGHVLIPAGAGMQGTGAAGEFVTSEPRFSGFLHRAGLDPASPLPRSEVLLKAGVLGGTVSRSEIVSFRVYTRGSATHRTSYQRFSRALKGHGLTGRSGG